MSIFSPQLKWKIFAFTFYCPKQILETSLKTKPGKPRHFHLHEPRFCQDKKFTFLFHSSVCSAYPKSKSCIKWEPWKPAAECHGERRWWLDRAGAKDGPGRQRRRGGVHRRDWLMRAVVQRLHLGGLKCSLQPQVSPFPLSHLLQLVPKRPCSVQAPCLWTCCTGFFFPGKTIFVTPEIVGFFVCLPQLDDELLEGRCWISSLKIPVSGTKPQAPGMCVESRSINLRRCRMKRTKGSKGRKKEDIG